MKRLCLFAVVAALFSPGLSASTTPDFWYVVPDDVSSSAATEVVRGIVVPSSVGPTVETTAAGSVISWRRPDGTTRSFVVQGVSAITLEPGPLGGTTYLPFRTSKRMQHDPAGCCSCASWQNSVESVEALSCVVGCIGCGCEGCICSPTFPCPTGPEAGLALAAENDPSERLTFGKSGTHDEIAVVRHGRATARFHGKRLAATVSSTGETILSNPDSIALSGPVTSRTTVSGDKALFAWRSPTASVILEQPRSMPAPSFRDGVVDFRAASGDEPTTDAKRLQVGPVMDRCSACGTHPNSDSDLDLYDCVPGFGVCYRCVSWECFAQKS
jgi:hypothetical protein